MEKIATSAKKLLNTVHDAAIFRRRVAVLSKHLADIIPNGGSVLDLGCGDGSIAVCVMRLRPDLSCEGVDVLVRPVTHIPVTRYDGTALPFADKSFDHVTIVDVLHHTNDPALVLKEAARVARQSVVIKDHLREGMLAGVTLRAMDWVGNRGHGVQLPYNYLTRSQWDTALASAGLVTVKSVEKLGLYPAPLSWFFDRKLHFVALTTPQ